LSGEGPQDDADADGGHDGGEPGGVVISVLGGIC